MDIKQIKSKLIFKANLFEKLMKYIPKTTQSPILIIFSISVICLPCTMYIMEHLPRQRIISNPQPPAPFNFEILPAKEEPVMTGFQITEYNRGEKSFTISAERFYLRNKKVKPFGFRIAHGKSAELERVEVIFYKDNKPISYLYSKTAVMNVKRKDVIFEGKPALITQDMKTLSAQKIIWNNFQKRLIAEGSCSLGAEGKRYKGGRIDTDIELKNFNITDKETGNALMTLTRRTK
ncbi:MAG: LPS export ABC transporter periplasmic protein LptC [Candidatus Omnitrophica bacterium]|nr:LPS export ABC transporter periplasmic protein LptC [Candidatus Omnitrophota bacterium]